MSGMFKFYSSPNYMPTGDEAKGVQAAQREELAADDLGTIKDFKQEARALQDALNGVKIENQEEKVRSFLDQLPKDPFKAAKTIKGLYAIMVDPATSDADFQKAYETARQLQPLLAAKTIGAPNMRSGFINPMVAKVDSLETAKEDKDKDFDKSLKLRELLSDLKFKVPSLDLNIGGTPIEAHKLDRSRIPSIEDLQSNGRIMPDPAKVQALKKWLANRGKNAQSEEKKEDKDKVDGQKNKDKEKKKINATIGVVQTNPAVTATVSTVGQKTRDEADALAKTAAEKRRQEAKAKEDAAKQQREKEERERRERDDRDKKARDDKKDKGLDVDKKEGDGIARNSARRPALDQMFAARNAANKKAAADEAERKKREAEEKRRKEEEREKKDAAALVLPPPPPPFKQQAPVPPTAPNGTGGSAAASQLKYPLALTNELDGKDALGAQRIIAGSLLANIGVPQHEINRLLDTAFISNFDSNQKDGKLLLRLRKMASDIHIAGKGNDYSQINGLIQKEADRAIRQVGLKQLKDEKFIGENYNDITAINADGLHRGNQMLSDGVNEDPNAWGKTALDALMDDKDHAKDLKKGHAKLAVDNADKFSFMGRMKFFGSIFSGGAAIYVIASIFFPPAAFIGALMLTFAFVGACLTAVAEVVKILMDVVKQIIKLTVGIVKLGVAIAVGVPTVGLGVLIDLVKSPGVAIMNLFRKFSGKDPIPYFPLTTGAVNLTKKAVDGVDYVTKGILGEPKDPKSVYPVKEDAKFLASRDRLKDTLERVSGGKSMVIAQTPAPAVAKAASITPTLPPPPAQQPAAQPKPLATNNPNVPPQGSPASNLATILTGPVMAGQGGTAAAPPLPPPPPMPGVPGGIGLNLAGKAIVPETPTPTPSRPRSQSFDGPPLAPAPIPGVVPSGINSSPLSGGIGAGGGDKNPSHLSGGGLGAALGNIDLSAIKKASTHPNPTDEQKGSVTNKQVNALKDKKGRRNSTGVLGMRGD